MEHVCPRKKGFENIKRLLQRMEKGPKHESGTNVMSPNFDLLDFIFQALCLLIFFQQRFQRTNFKTQMYSSITMWSGNGPFEEPESSLFGTDLIPAAQLTASVLHRRDQITHVAVHLSEKDNGPGKQDTGLHTAPSGPKQDRRRYLSGAFVPNGGAGLTELLAHRLISPHLALPRVERAVRPLKRQYGTKICDWPHPARPLELAKPPLSAKFAHVARLMVAW